MTEKQLLYAKRLQSEITARMDGHLIGNENEKIVHKEIQIDDDSDIINDLLEIKRRIDYLEDEAVSHLFEQGE